MAGSLRSASLRLRGVTVSALVGASGTGKSFRARLVAEKRGIDVIVDDGILIHGDAILAGHWAKKEKTILAATRRALFDSPEHAREARDALGSISFHSVLIVGTSPRMTQRIARALGLPRPSTVIAMEELARDSEIEAAGRRRRAGSHAIPTPPVRVRRGPLSALVAGAGSLAAALRRRAGGKADGPASLTWEKPARGGVAITEAALRQMVGHCVAEHDPRIGVEKVRIHELGGMHDVEIGIRVPWEHATAGDLHRLRDYIMHSLERHAGIVVREVRLVIDTVSPGGP